MDFADLIGQTLDEKYRIERELGRGGMGTVYLATHLGTERPVAVKIIAPQYMERPEFVERFRREARAAGRLRHPNVVDVTDFGFSETQQGKAAYLVMEYLDGCTLGEILEEEKNLPLGWTLDILEQVCSAVHEAHEQGIIHRDLKPDNIWLEPNQRGGYTVKVLDFGIAKLEESVAGESGEPGAAFARLQEPGYVARPTFGGNASDDTIADGGSATIAHAPDQGTLVSEARTMIQSEIAGAEARTAILTPAGAEAPDQETVGTRLISSQIDPTRSHDEHRSTEQSLFDAQTTGALTRVGAVLGTPLYMSPEQCSGEKLDARSDVYSLGVIAYQMLSGKTPFSGDFTGVMEAHKHLSPPVIAAKKVRRKVKKVIHSALEKDRAVRPQSAQAFASELRAQSEGIGELLRRAMIIYSQHLPKFLGLAVLLYIPFAAATLLNIIVNVLFLSRGGDSALGTALKVCLTLFSTFTGIFCSYLIVGTTTWLVNQILSVPLRPVRLKPALNATRKNWKRLIGTGLLATGLTFLGYALCFIPGLYLSLFLALVAPVVMMENLRGFAALRRSRQLVKRSMRTTFAAVAIMFLVPLMIASVTSFVVAVSVKAFSDSADKIAAVKNEASSASGEQNADASTVSETRDKENENTNIRIGNDGIQITTDDDPGMGGRIKGVVREGLTAVLMLPFQILIASLSSIIGALLYLKTRQVGGESMQDLMAKFEETEQPRKKWQERVRNRLIQSGRITSKP